MKHIIFIGMLFFSLCASAQVNLVPVKSWQKQLLGIEVHFRLNKSKLDEGYMGNKQSLLDFAHMVDSIGLEHIDSVVVMSQSSPEGPYSYNMKLSERRANTMLQTISSRHPELKGRLFVHPDGESWTQLRELVAKDTVLKAEEIERVLQIIDSDMHVNQKKSRMKQQPCYRYLLRTYYPRIRNSMFCILYFTEKLTPLPMEVMPPFQIPELVVDPLPMPALEVRKEPVLNVHTNLLYDLGTALNVGVEYYPHNSRWSVVANYTFPWWGGEKKHRYMQLIDGELQVRRYFDKKADHAGHYLSAYVHGGYYDFSFNAERAWQGEGAGFGLGYGYVWRPWKDKRWKLEAFIRLGYYHSLYDPYHASDPYNGKYYYDWDGAVEDFERRNYRFRWLGPTGLGITLSYDLLQRKLKY